MKHYDSELLCVKHYVNQSYFVQNCVNQSLNENSVSYMCKYEVMCRVFFILMA